MSSNSSNLGNTNSSKPRTTALSTKNVPRIASGLPHSVIPPTTISATTQKPPNLTKPVSRLSQQPQQTPLLTSHTTTSNSTRNSYQQSILSTPMRNFGNNDISPPRFDSIKQTTRGSVPQRSLNTPLPTNRVGFPGSAGHSNGGSEGGTPHPTDNPLHSSHSSLASSGRRVFTRYDPNAVHTDSKDDELQYIFDSQRDFHLNSQLQQTITTLHPVNKLLFSQNAKLTEECENLSENVATLTRENVALTTELNAVKRQLEDKTGLYDELFAKCDQFQKDNEELLSKYQKLQENLVHIFHNNENITLSNDLGQFDDSLSEIREKYQHQYQTQLEEQLTMVKNMTSIQQQLGDAITHGTTVNAQLQHKFDQHLAKLQNAHNSVIDRITQSIYALNQDVSDISMSYVSQNAKNDTRVTLLKDIGDILADNQHSEPMSDLDLFTHQDYLGKLKNKLDTLFESVSTKLTQFTLVSQNSLCHHDDDRDTGTICNKDDDNNYLEHSTAELEELLKITENSIKTFITSITTEHQSETASYSSKLEELLTRYNQINDTRTENEKVRKKEICEHYNRVIEAYTDYIDTLETKLDDLYDIYMQNITIYTNMIQTYQNQQSVQESKHCHEVVKNQQYSSQLRLLHGQLDILYQFLNNIPELLHQMPTATILTKHNFKKSNQSESSENISNDQLESPILSLIAKFNDNINESQIAQNCLSSRDNLPNIASSQDSTVHIQHDSDNITRRSSFLNKISNLPSIEQFPLTSGVENDTNTKVSLVDDDTDKQLISHDHDAAICTPQYSSQQLQSTLQTIHSILLSVPAMISAINHKQHSYYEQIISEYRDFHQNKLKSVENDVKIDNSHISDQLSQISSIISSQKIPRLVEPSQSSDNDNKISDLLTTLISTITTMSHDLSTLHQSQQATSTTLSTLLEKVEKQLFQHPPSPSHVGPSIHHPSISSLASTHMRLYDIQLPPPHFALNSHVSNTGLLPNTFTFLTPSLTPGVSPPSQLPTLYRTDALYPHSQRHSQLTQTYDVVNTFSPLSWSNDENPLINNPSPHVTTQSTNITNNRSHHTHHTLFHSSASCGNVFTCGNPRLGGAYIHSMRAASRNKTQDLDCDGKTIKSQPESTQLSPTYDPLRGIEPHIIQHDVSHHIGKESVGIGHVEGRDGDLYGVRFLDNDDISYFSSTASSLRLNDQVSFAQQLAAYQSKVAHPKGGTNNKYNALQNALQSVHTQSGTNDPFGLNDDDNNDDHDNDNDNDTDDDTDNNNVFVTHEMKQQQTAPQHRTDRSNSIHSGHKFFSSTQPQSMLSSLEELGGSSGDESDHIRAVNHRLRRYNKSVFSPKRMLSPVQQSPDGTTAESNEILYGHLSPPHKNNDITHNGAFISPQFLHYHTPLQHTDLHSNTGHTPPRTFITSTASYSSRSDIFSPESSHHDLPSSNYTTKNHILPAIFFTILSILALFLFFWTKSPTFLDNLSLLTSNEPNFTKSSIIVSKWHHFIQNTTDFLSSFFVVPTVFF